jgi:hypothetical protein
MAATNSKGDNKGRRSLLYGGAVTGLGCATASAGLLICACIVYLGLWFVVGPPTDFAKVVLFGRQSLLREDAESALGPRGFSLDAQPVVMTQNAADQMVLSGTCVNGAGEEQPFRAEFARVNGKYECIRVVIGDE